MPIPAKPATYRFDGERLRSIRESNKLTREELAARLHCSVARIAHAELGYNVPSISKAAEFAAALGIRVDDLLIYDAEAVAT
jgi:transcriptional regulator with XRE-family HTH domain